MGSFNQAIQGSGQREYMVTTADGAEALPLTTGNIDYTITEMEPGNERTYIEVAFYSDEELTTKVNPTAGTVTIVGSMTRRNIERTIDNGTFAAADWQNANLNIPAASGTVRNLRVNFNGVTGAAYAAVSVLKY